MDCLKNSRAQFVILLLASFLFASSAAHAQGQQRGDATLRMEFQAIRTGTFVSDGADFDYWTTDTRVAVVSGDYALNERWSVFAALPYVRKRFNSEVPWGGDPHNPNDPYWIDFVPPDTRFWDDGEYHGDFQDFSIGVAYRFEKGPVTFFPVCQLRCPCDRLPVLRQSRHRQKPLDPPGRRGRSTTYLTSRTGTSAATSPTSFQRKPWALIPTTGWLI